MICAISGEAPQAPVVSRKNGNVYERRLIEQYIRENGTDPVDGSTLTPDDLLDLKQPRTIKPRAPTATSIPALLSTFQNEWDALILETYQLKQSLATTRQELSAALYYNDAAEKVIARLTRERDEARDALSKVTVSSQSNGSKGDAMQIDGQGGLPEGVLARIDKTKEDLSGTRRKRKVPETWSTAENVSTFDWTSPSDPLVASSRFLAVNQTADSLLVGGDDGRAAVYSASRKKLLHTLDCGSAGVVAGLWSGDLAVVGLSNGGVKVFREAAEVATFSSHAGAVVATMLHPCGDLILSVGVDKSLVYYDMQTNAVIRQQFINSDITCATLHPDGYLLAIGTAAGKVELYDVKSLEQLATFDTPTGTSLSALTFSENGIWLATTSKNQGAISIWDLRKTNVIHTIEVGAEIHRLAWDFTGQFLAVLATGSMAVHHYSKASKAWNGVWNRAAKDLVDVAWGSDAQSLIAVDKTGHVTMAVESK